MPLLLWISTAVLVFFFMYLIVGAWRLSRGRGRIGSRAERVTLAVLFGLVTIQAVMWIYTGHPESSKTRNLAVLVQLLTAFGSVLVLLVSGWITRSRGQAR